MNNNILNDDEKYHKNGFFVPILGIIGVGLIGGSFALSLRNKNRVGKVIGVGRNNDSLINAKNLGIIDVISSLEEVSNIANMIVISTPVSYFSSLFKKILPTLNDSVIITDVGSTKVEVIKQARLILGKKISQFIPAHPMAGSDESGPQAANAELFQNRKVIITPLEDNLPSDINYIKNAWNICGANVLKMLPKEHDDVMAAVSHIPHLLSSIYMSCITKSENVDLLLSIAGSGFKDFTRIAGSSSEMWSDIFLSNKSAVLSYMNSIQLTISDFIKLIENNDINKLRFLLNQSSDKRRNWHKD
ncbi:Prephenate dehydrogenase [Candidatus Kinetoplastibacterium sorsogonicusi]|uniref:Prephenate dehydrogenase n=1 Tax=Candidatus Kinetoplastidibacterium kentomonadis TaxID=1576550 RepID=A0A3S7JA30_9PROT|nr:prephenate dehydrogenase/arogenate dehydrogenase family protein [Candidatus Kinetoplastibacterium sorsogonicusi]AWD32528.1 Prephenate dehydrogenase [Candidatus Kinetoplastibacterium sorsogonicusi]